MSRTLATTTQSRTVAKLVKLGRLVTGVLASTLAMTVTSEPLAARPVERGHFSESLTEFVDCGDLTARVDVDVDWAFLLKSQGRDLLPYGMETSHGEQVWTNMTTGRSLTVVTNFVVKDQQISDNGDGTLTIVVQSSGGVNVFGPDGTLLFKDPGQSRSVLLIDNGGTPADPTDDVFLKDLGQVKGSTGRNDLEGRSFCDLVREYAVI
jgi:hypothetical protein